MTQEIKLPDPDMHCLDDDFNPPRDVWSYSAELVRQIIEADRAQRGEPVGTLTISHHKGFENFDLDYFGSLPDGNHAIYTAQQPAHIDAQPSQPERKFQLGNTVCKTKGSQWHGIIVGFYSTDLTPIGYAVESATERGSVQIYPESALETWEPKP